MKKSHEEHDAVENIAVFVYSVFILMMIGLN